MYMMSIHRGKKSVYSGLDQMYTFSMYKGLFKKIAHYIIDKISEWIFSKKYAIGQVPLKYC